MATPHNAPKRTLRGSAGFEELSLRQSSFQPAAVDPYDQHARRLRDWRNNLTALSQVHNLYFVAFADQLCIFQPQYPTQSVVSQRPSLTIDLPRSAEDLQGHLDPHCPHCINHVLVADLGDDEIVVCACDDGDVLAYFTDNINAFLQRRHAAERRQSEFKDSLKPFFHYNVHKSAWGLAVHTNARMIAVSCNSLVTHVFAFGLKPPPTPSRPSSESSSDSRGPGSPFIDTRMEDEMDDENYMFYTDPYEAWRVTELHVGICLNDDGSLARDNNYRMELVRAGHQSNIPQAAFCNTPDDPSGKYLLSCDISGSVRLWDVHHRMPLKILYPTVSNPDRDWHFSPLWSAWGLHWVDKRAFRKTNSHNVALQYCVLWRDQFDCLVDVSVTKKLVNDSGRWTIGDADTPDAMDIDHRGSGAFNRGGGVVDDWLEGDPDGEEGEEFGSEDDNERTDTSDSESVDVIASAPQNINTHSGVAQVRLDPQNWCIDTSRQRGLPPNAYDSSHCHLFKDHFLGRDNAMQHASGFKMLTEPSDPVLIFNPRAMHLFQSTWSMQRDFAGPRYPTIFFNDPLEQDIHPAWRARVDTFDRMNLTVQIPELGVILAGSPKGRVAVFSLHELHPNPFAREPATPIRTMRLDHILPRQSQEHRNERPPQTLIGVAASPLQGHSKSSQRPGEAAGAQAPSTARKWRILLLYRDQTLLSYEIRRRSRDEKTRDAEVGGVLVV